MIDVVKCSEEQMCQVKVSVCKACPYLNKTCEGGCDYVAFKVTNSPWSTLMKESIDLLFPAGNSPGWMAGLHG